MNDPEANGRTMAAALECLSQLVSAAYPRAEWATLVVHHGEGFPDTALVVPVREPHRSPAGG